MLLNFLNSVLKRYCKSMENELLKCVGTLIIGVRGTTGLYDAVPCSPNKSTQFGCFRLTQNCSYS